MSVWKLVAHVCKTSEEGSADIRVARATVDTSRVVEGVGSENEPSTVNIIGIRVHSKFIAQVSIHVYFYILYLYLYAFICDINIYL